MVGLWHWVHPTLQSILSREKVPAMPGVKMSGGVPKDLPHLEQIHQVLNKNGWFSFGSAVSLERLSILLMMFTSCIILKSSMLDIPWLF